MLNQLCEAYAGLRNDSEAWAEEQADRAAWQAAALSGIENE